MKIDSSFFIPRSSFFIGIVKEQVFASLKEWPAMDYHIPPEIDAQYEGEWIAWDTATNQVIGHGITLEEVMDQTRSVDHRSQLIWYHHILPRDVEILGGF
jgi:Family of unknown function (DUF5678)